MGFWDGSGISWLCANNVQLTPDRQPHQHLITQFLQAGCPSCRPTNSIKALKAHKISYFLCTTVFLAHSCWILILKFVKSMLQSYDNIWCINLSFRYKRHPRTILVNYLSLQCNWPHRCYMAHTYLLNATDVNTIFSLSFEEWQP